MKKILLCLMVTLFPFAVSAQRDSLFLKNKSKIQYSLLKTNLLPILLGPITFPNDSGLPYPLTSEYRLMYEAPISPNQSILAGVSYLGKNIIYVIAGTDTGQNAKDLRNLSISGFRVQGMFRHYLIKKWMAPRGLYIGPHASYAYAKVSEKSNRNVYFKFINWNINAICGFQLVAGKAAMDLFMGLGYKNNVIETHVRGRKPKTDKIGITLPHTKFTFGFNFGIAL